MHLVGATCSPVASPSSTLALPAGPAPWPFAGSPRDTAHARLGQRCVPAAALLLACYFRYLLGLRVKQELLCLVSRLQRLIVSRQRFLRSLKHPDDILIAAAHRLRTSRHCLDEHCYATAGCPYRDEQASDGEDQLTQVHPRAPPRAITSASCHSASWCSAWVDLPSANRRTLLE